METALSVANYFVQKSIDECVPLTPMKLVKLAYISKGWYLGLTDGNELFQDDIQAWKYGPVVAAVYYKFRHYGKGNINEQAKEYRIGANRQIVLDQPMVKDQNVIKFLDRIWEVYKCYDGIELSAMTHRPDTPWDIAYNKLGGKHVDGFVIPNDLIKTHYQALSKN